MEEQSIILVIADRPYKLQVRPEDEALFRDATKHINERIKVYKTYAFKDSQDLIAMVALQYTTNALRNERMVKFRDQDMITKLNAVNEILTSAVL
ncbi:hypothetical protein FACS1894201_02820 [Bacteroidia bacterium]|nr:hypothetical protein FACS1894201_02820 [Bacteroidia bacterium]